MWWASIESDVIVDIKTTGGLLRDLMLGTVASYIWAILYIMVAS